MAKKQNKANLFQFTVYLKQDGNVEMNWDGVPPDLFESTINKGMPEYEGAHSIASLLRYLRSNADDIMEKSRQFI
jgi:hypothetical protein